MSHEELKRAMQASFREANIDASLDFLKLRSLVEKFYELGFSDGSLWALKKAKATVDGKIREGRA